MKIPTILASADIPATLPDRRVPQNPLAAAGPAVAGALGDVADAALRGLKADQRQYMKSVDSEAALLGSRMDLSAGVGVENAKLERDPDAFAMAADKAIK